MAIAAATRSHYRAEDLLVRVGTALDPRAAAPTVEELAALDQFHTRGLAATADLAASVDLRPGESVLDLGCGLGGPARYLARRHGVLVTGVDQSEAYVETASDLSRRCGLEASTRFITGDALAPPTPGVSFDAVFLQHVAMNVADRAALYRAIFQMLRSGGRFATYDIVERDGAVLYPTPWAQDPEDSHLLSEAATREALLDAGFEIKAWWDDSESASAWFAQMRSGGPPPGPNLSLVLGPSFPIMAENLRRNLAERRTGVLAAVLVKP